MFGILFPFLGSKNPLSDLLHSHSPINSPKLPVSSTPWASFHASRKKCTFTTTNKQSKRSKQSVTLLAEHSIAYADRFPKTAIIAAPAPRLPACRKCSSSQRTQLATTQKGANIGRKYYTCIGCPAPDSGGRSFIVWADQITV